MNKRGHSETLVASHPGNTNAGKAGVYSPRMLEPRIAELEAALDLLPATEVRRDVARRDLAGLIALTEAMDAALAEGVVGQRGKPRDLVRLRLRASAVLRSAVLEHDAAVAAVLELAEPTGSAEENEEPAPVEGDLIAELAKAFRVVSLDEIQPVGFEAELFLDVIATSEDPMVRAVDRRRANNLLLKLRNARSPFCLCLDVLRARDRLEFEQWVEQFRQHLTPRSDDPILAAIIRQHAHDAPFDRPYDSELTQAALEWLTKYELARAEGRVLHEGGEKEEAEDDRVQGIGRDHVYRRLWKAMLSRNADPVKDRLEAYVELERAGALRKCVCRPVDTRLDEIRNDAVRAFIILSFVRRTQWGALVRVERPESYIAVRQMLDAKVLVEYRALKAEQALDVAAEDEGAAA
jgi:hypothetical protein